MAIIQPTWHGPLVNSDGTLSKPLIDLLRLLATTAGGAATGTDLTALTARLAALEGDTTAVTVYGPNVYETSPGSFEVRASDGASDPLVCQIFGS